MDLEALITETLVSELRELKRLQEIRDRHIEHLPRPLRMLAVNWRIRRACRRVNLLRSTQSSA